MLNFAAILLLIMPSAIWALSPGDEMPDFVGQTYYGELQDKLKTQGFDVTFVEGNRSAAGRSGVVTGQIPAAGESLPKANKNGLIPITLTIAPILVEIPDVVGMTYPQAQVKLYARGLTSARFIKVTESGAGLVVDQFPASEMKVAKGTRVTLTVNQTLPLEDDNDGCISQGQTCVCVNTGWERYCDYGPHRKGLYCQCD